MSVEVDAVIYYRVVDPARAIIQVENYKTATSLLSQTTLEDVLGQIELDDLLSEAARELQHSGVHCSSLAIGSAEPYQRQ